MSKDLSATAFDSEARLLLQRASLELVRTGDDRGLIALVERWCATEAVPPSILISEVRALLNFKLMDRAWVRLRELSKLLPDDLEVTCLTCEMFIGRGWPARAEKLLRPLVSVGGYPAIVDDLFLRSQRSAISAPVNAKDIELGGSGSERLALAEFFLATGSQLRARSVLERIRHDAVGGSKRAEDLLWGLDAGFDNETQPLIEVARKITGEGLLGGVDAINLDDLSGENTSEVTVAGGGELFEGADPSFPSLFRSVDTEEDEDGVAEATKVTSLSSLLDEAPLETVEQTAGDGLGGEWEDGFDDTRVMVVVSQDKSDGDDGLSNENQALHEDEFDAFDLENSELGITGLLEGEDADLIVLTNDESVESEEERDPVDHAPMTVVEPELPAPKVELADASLPDPASPPAEPQPPAPPVSTGRVPTQATSSKANRPAKRRRQPVLQSTLTVRKMLQITLAVALVCVVFVAYAANKKRDAQAASVVTEILGAMSGTDAAWRGTSAVFERRVSTGFDATRRNELGLVILEMLLWRESGNVESSLEIIESDLMALEDELSGSTEYSLARAEFSILLGDYEGLTVLLDGLDQTGWAEIQHLRSASLLHADNLAAARGFAEAAVSLSSNSVRYLKALGRICSLEGDAHCVESVADTLYRIAPDSAYATIMQIAGVESPLSDARLDDVLRQTTPREASQSLLWFAQLSGDPAVVDQAVDRALGLDPENREARYLKGVRRLGQGEVSGAEMDFTVCLNLMPASFDCQLGLALSQFELDHVDEAAAWIVGEGGLGTRYSLNPVLLGWLQVEQGASISSVAELGDYRPYLRAIAERDGSAMLEAADDLLERGGVINKFLGARGLARAARFGVEQAGVADRAYALAPLDPVVLTDLAWLWDSVGYARRSRLMFRVAFERGGESAYTLVERGRFYLDLGDNFRTTRAAWYQYRDLSPTGPRSEARLSSLERLR